MSKKKRTSHIITGYIGQTGSGKTFLMKKQIKNIRKIISFDPEGQLRDLFFPCESLKDFCEILDRKINEDFQINCVFHEIEDYNTAFEIVWTFCSDMTVAIDEASNFSSNFNESDYLTKIITRGRLKNISLYWNTQRPALVSKTLTSQSHKIYAFRLLDYADLDFIPRRFRSKEEELRISKFKIGEYILVRGEEK